MTLRQIELETISFVIIAAFISSFFVWRNNQNFQSQFHVVVPIVAGSNQNVITPASNPILKIDTATQISPDGTKMLIMKTTHNIDGTLTYVISAADGSGANERELYTTKVKGSESMSVPFNAWSPDNKYLFVHKNGNYALVFKATGEPIASNQTYFDVADLFRERNYKDTFSQATGWASPTLLIFNTIKQDGTKGYSYWFEVPSKAIIQLSSEF